jgi:hypothetical protein
MIVLLSHQYVSESVSYEFGKIPICMTPLMNRSICELQIMELRKRWPLVKMKLTLPENYTLGDYEAHIFGKYSVQIVSLPENYSNSKAVLTCLNSNENLDIVRVISPGILVKSIPDAVSCIGLSSVKAGYSWHIEKRNNDYDIVWNGYFSFSNYRLLMGCLMDEEFDFNRAVERYSFKSKIQKIEVNDWYDVNDINSYFYSRSKLASSRSFNAISVSNNILTKRSKDKVKMKAEANWFDTMPPELRHFIPSYYKFWDDNKGGAYSIEYIYSNPLSELFVHGKHGLLFWKNIFNKIAQCLNAFKYEATTNNTSCPNIDLLNQEWNYLIKTKTIERFSEFIESDILNFNLETKLIFNGVKLPCLDKIINDLIDQSLAIGLNRGYVHGDLCFSNILYDTRSDAIKLIDPRGLFSSETSGMIGNVNYDLAKLSHSVVGLYDHIIAGHFLLEINDTNFDFNIITSEEVDGVIDYFSSINLIDDLNLTKILPLVSLLFFSMLPLHSDNEKRQKALFANALRIYLMVNKNHRMVY